MLIYFELVKVVKPKSSGKKVGYLIFDHNETRNPLIFREPDVLKMDGKGAPMVKETMRLEIRSSFASLMS